MAGADSSMAMAPDDFVDGNSALFQRRRELQRQLAELDEEIADRRTANRVRRQIEDVTAEIWETDYGVVSVFDTEHDRAFAFHRTWDGYEISTLMAWIRSTQAQNYDQWLNAAKDVATTINWYYADKDGNIGYVSPGYLPVRQDSQDLRLPAKGDGSQDWQGIRPFADVPKTLNPMRWIGLTAFSAGALL